MTPAMSLQTNFLANPRGLSVRLAWRSRSKAGLKVQQVQTWIDQRFMGEHAQFSIRSLVTSRPFRKGGAASLGSTAKTQRGTGQNPLNLRICDD